MNNAFSRCLLTSLLLTLVAAPLACAEDAEGQRAARPVNFVILLCDNLGYGDVGCFGSELHRTPHIDRMAKEGLRLTSFYSTSGVCTPSRASLLTGCYPRRVNLHVDEHGAAVLRPVAGKGLHPNETTIAELLQARGYATACIGKWHLGDQPAFLPTRQGFDLYFGIPYSDDMTARRGTRWPPLPLMQGERVVEAPADRNTLTSRYTEQAIEFIKANHDRPFFLYLPHAMPGSTQRPFASEAFQGRSRNGAYGDAVEELDWSTGQILETIDRLDLDERTLVIWTSDNGAPRRNPPQGSNKPLGGWGYTTAEGGMRVPCVIRWPGRVPAGRSCDELATMMDLLPTLVRLAGAELPPRKIDGHDIRPLLLGQKDARTPYDAFYYYHKGQLQAVRSGKWKLHLGNQRKLTSLSNKRSPFKAELYDLAADVGETNNLAEQHPEIVKRLTKLAATARNEYGDDDHQGAGQRPAGTVEDPQPQAAAARVKRPRVILGEAARETHNNGFVFDGHNDLPWQIRNKASSTFEKMDISKHQQELHTDIPRLRAGNVGAQFWSVYVPSETRLRGESLLQTLEQIELVHAMCRRYPETFEIALTTDDIARIRQKGKIASLIGVEGGHSIENSLENLRRLHRLGARYMTLTHSDTLDWADSATDKPKHDGLSDFGNEVVQEMNRLGMLVDLSHVSPATMKDAIAKSKAPVMFSHSSARAVADHVRNVPDDVLKLVAENNGVVMVNFYSGFVEPESARRSARSFDVSRELRKKFPDEADYRKARKAYEAKNPILPGTVHDVVDHIDHIAKVAGIDHVGLGGDFDGVSMLPEQLEDVSTYPIITQELLNRGYQPEDIQKINSGNILRVLQAAEAASARLKAADRPDAR